MPLRAALLLLFFAAAAWAPPASAQAVHRCVDARGVSVFSDQPCESQDAVRRQEPVRAAESAQGFRTGTGSTAAGCARTPDALLLGVRGALEARDVNRLATHYHWPGTGANAGRYLMDELEEIAARPLVAAELVFPVPPAEMAPDPYASPAAAPPVEAPGPATAATVEPASPMPPADPAAAPRPPAPVGLRVEQMSGPADAGARTVHFLLRRNAGCWWIEL